MDKVKVARLSVFSNLFLTISKIIIGLFTSSVSILSEGIHSGMDLIASIIAFLSVKHSDKPADEKHAYGHGKIENVSATIESILIFVAACLIVWESIKKIIYGISPSEVTLGLIIMGISAILNFFVSSELKKVAKETNSIALEADALHLKTDVYTSLGVFVGLLLIKITGWFILDPIIAIFVALLILKEAYHLLYEAFLPLLDGSLSENELQLITNSINQYSNEFVEYHELRSRRSGPTKYIDLHLVFEPNETVKNAHDICNKIENDIVKLIPNGQVLIHIEPKN